MRSRKRGLPEEDPSRNRSIRPSRGRTHPANGRAPLRGPPPRQGDGSRTSSGPGCHPQGDQSRFDVVRQRGAPDGDLWTREFQNHRGGVLERRRQEHLTSGLGLPPIDAKETSSGSGRAQDHRTRPPSWLPESGHGSGSGHFTVFTSGARPWIRTSSRSPDSMGPMPLGVPVRMMSPGSIVMFVETKLTMLKQLKISWLVLLF